MLYYNITEVLPRSYNIGKDSKDCSEYPGGSSRTGRAGAKHVGREPQRIRNIPVEVPLGPNERLSKACVANLDTITTIPKSIFLSRISVLSASKVVAINAAIRFALGLD